MSSAYLGLWLFMSISAYAQLETFTPPGQNSISYSVNIPRITAFSGSGPIYFQLKSTSNLQWFAWGQGSQMRGANIFVVYSSVDGTNITVSPRLGGRGHTEPTFNSDAQISVLSGSGISDGMITANIRCDSCITWPGGSEDPTSSSSPWIWAVKFGRPLNSNSVSSTITIHDASGVAALNLQNAVGGTSDNPFVSSNNTKGSGHAIMTTATGSLNNRRIAHAVIMTVVFGLLFPMFAFMLHAIPYSRVVDIHAALQLFTIALVIAGFGLGISLAKSLGLINNYHPIIGMVAVPALILFQPAMGFLQHSYFHKTGRKSVFAYTHRWFGRSIIVLGVVNGGLGLHLAKTTTSSASTGAIIAYSVVVGIIGLAYIFGVIFWPRRTHG
ncbi:hypothetical protein ASPWEDRAFT_39656 [Aspergillus wentii DTO 134E9]|uniref:DOMON domain-containing protein n=1 Tax=Aspergillus wentii DTO 134E9 TaxID=1073089 RepID=A0A1L9RSM2_ASPWE|nr:uncharacterized protein ASPWEDRAFT_39656 [Aspergillus wentii DTO 134E9]OJJ37951.1 hypothetical protein ASPWEDRAFT_39656 [Aspergillus wentii DTO 134E9]